MVTRRGSLSGQVRLTKGIKPSDIINEVFANPELRRAIEDFTLDEAEYYQRNTPVGGTGDLKGSWDVIPPKKSIVGLSLEFSIINTAPNALFRIAGRGPGGKPPIEPLRLWTIATGRRLGTEWALQKRIALEGTQRWQEGTNWVGIRNDGSVIPGGRLDTMEGRLQQFLDRRINR